jgi:hypothetical protein
MLYTVHMQHVMSYPLKKGSLPARIRRPGRLVKQLSIHVRNFDLVLVTFPPYLTVLLYSTGICCATFTLD